MMTPPVWPQIGGILFGKPIMVRSEEPQMTKAVISLTSIPPRFSGLTDCLTSLLNQTADIAEIVLYLPRTYRRFPGTWDLPDVPHGVKIRRCDADLGPATKVLPALVDNAGTDNLILFCDDDKIYAPDWAQQLISSATAHPNDAVALFGMNVTHVSHFNWESRHSPAAQFVTKDWRYRAKRALSFGHWKPPFCQSSGYADTLCGWAGCAVRPGFFREEDFSIPDVLWTVDDIWLSGCLAKNGISIWLENTAKDRRATRGVNDIKSDALTYFTYKGFNRAQANHACVRYFRDTYGIWGGGNAQKASGTPIPKARAE